MLSFINKRSVRFGLAIALPIVLVAARVPGDFRQTSSDIELVGAVARQQPERVELLLNAGASANAKMHPKCDIIARLKMACGVQQDRWQPVLNTACGGKSAQIVSLLLARGAKVDSPDYRGATPLMEAIEHENTVLVPILLHYSPNLAVRDKFGLAALDRAVEAGQVASVRALVAHGADPNARDHFGNRPLAELGYVGENNRLDIVRTLVENFADVDNVDAQGRSALFYADGPVALYLLARGVDIGHRHLDGNTPLIFEG